MISLAEQNAWQTRYNHRQDAKQFDTQKLINLLLDQLWHHECQIITDWMPAHPRADTQPFVAVRHYADGEHKFLRYSKGPLQGYFWDCYPEDMHSPELALIAISRAPAPRNAMCVPTHGK